MIIEVFIIECNIALAHRGILLSELPKDNLTKAKIGYRIELSGASQNGGLGLPENRKPIGFFRKGMIYHIRIKRTCESF